MRAMEYKVIPFIAAIDANKGTSKHVADQLEEIIEHHSNQGWNYVRLESVSTQVLPQSGCFGLRSSPGYTTTRQMIVFKKG
ncbi:hypothetical protein SAMN04488513_11428 [Pseudozobellia thermophila]|uniref:DUF4177 domain-containing protein n=2 Tax=Pseudozobellia thermophila TaxID=192903 RepID=A0A1M6NML0_9FLAO|nr:hypothetical protein SAMN04488513_11428 [Pseudozobellia thermophila]